MTQSAVKERQKAAGFTLIEMSIVLVIVGLLAGGVLVGQDLTRAAYIRAQISQIENFNTAVNTFYGKYQALPGDMNASTAQANGFAPRGQYAGEGDGNGIIEGVAVDQAGDNYGSFPLIGETAMFWEDLSYANGMNIGLIEGSFRAASTTMTPSPTGGANPGDVTVTSSPSLSNFFPSAKLGRGNFIYVWSGGWNAVFGSPNGVNYFGLSIITDLPTSPAQDLPTNVGVTVSEAYRIDAKIDDGRPQSGRVLALYPNPDPMWAGDSDSTIPNTTNPVVPGDGVSSAASASSCYDNGNLPGATENYSTGTNGGAGLNCALSFQMQGGD
jgi:prepilin-type N-terminal cleavage/methylation domain-containing protein